MTTTHTPGPWDAWEFDARSLAVGPAAGGLAVAEIVTANAHGIHTAQTEQIGQANARLITAAPDLLAALADMINAFGHYCEGDPSDDEIDALAKACAAIAKAQGEL